MELEAWSSTQPRNKHQAIELNFLTCREEDMGIEQAPTEKGKDSARGLKDSSRSEEERVEDSKGSDLAKGADRVDERSRSSDGRGPGEKQIG